MIVYLNNRKYIEEQREFGLGNFFKNIGSVFSKKPATAAASSSVVSGRVKRGGNKVLNTSGVTPVVPGTKPVNTPKTTISGTNVKVDANADIQMQAHQYLNSGQVKSAQANADKITASANQGNKKFEKQQQLLNKADEANQVLNAGGNTYVMGAKSTGDIKAAINNANNGTVSWSKDIHGANTNPVNVNQYQGQVTNKPTTKITQQGSTNVQQGTGASGVEIKQQSQNLQGQRNPSEVTADEASRSTKLTITKPKPKETVSNNTQQPANQPANTQQANNTQQQPANTQQQQQPANNTQSTNTGQNNNTTTNNNNSKTENKPNWWNRWGKTTAKVTAGVGAVGTLGAGVYGLHEMHKMTSSDDR